MTILAIVVVLAICLIVGAILFMLAGSRQRREKARLDCIHPTPIFHKAPTIEEQQPITAEVAEQPITRRRYGRMIRPNGRRNRNGDMIAGYRLSSAA